VTTTPENKKDFHDHYEVLQLSPNADSETINRVYRILVKRYHPDRSPGTEDKFNEILEAYRVLSDPDARAAYDVKYDENRTSDLKIFKGAPVSDSFDTDRRIFEGILSLLYVARRHNPDRGGMGVIQLERLLGCPAEHLEFHVWYLLEKNWILRQNNGQLAITVAGIDHMIQDSGLVVRRDRMIAERSALDPPAL
jgi:curved DNA-binding protein